MKTLFEDSRERQSLNDDRGPGTAAMTVASAELGVFGSESAEITQPKTTKEQEPMTTVVALDEPGDEREDWHQRLRSLQECICELLIRNQELRMALLDSGRLTNESDEFVREHRSQSPVISWNSSVSRSCAGSRVLDHERFILVAARAHFRRMVSAA